MNYFLINLYKLYSFDDSVSYQAILEKKNWMFQKLYVPISFKAKIVNQKDIYEELYALIDQAFVFKSLSYQKSKYGNYDSKKVKKMIDIFNQNYSYLYLTNVIDFDTEKDIFYAEIDLSKISQETYKILVANFFPCLKEEELEIKLDLTSIVEILKLAMLNEKGFVFILENDKLLDKKLFLPVIKKLHYQSNLDQEKVETIEEIARRLNVEVIIHD